MNPIKQLAAGWRQKQATIPYPTYTGWTPRVPNIRHIGDGSSNSAVAATVRSLGRGYAEPDLFEYVQSGDQWEVAGQPSVIANPNPTIEMSLLATFTVASIATAGSAFFHKTRNGLGEVIELWPIYPNYITPQSSKEQYLSGWKYAVPGHPAVTLPPEDVIQLRWELGRTDIRLGHAPLQDVLQDVLQDHEAQQFSTTLLANLGIPGVVLSPSDPNDPGPPDPKAMAATFQEKFSGTHRGEPFVSNRGLKVDVVSFNPDQMDLSALRRVPEERITAALGWPAILAGLGAGLERGTYSNASSLREFATEQTLVPLWDLAQKQWTRQLLWDRKVDVRRQLRYDLSTVRALSTDQDDLVKRMDTAVRGGWATVAEGRRAVGLPVEAAHDIFLRPINTIPVGLTETSIPDAGI